MNIRRPWVPDDETQVWIGEQLSTLSDEQKLALDYWCGYLAAKQFMEGKPDAAQAYLGLVSNIRAAIRELPNARKRATAQFDPRKLVRSEDVPEPVEEEISASDMMQAARGARSSDAGQQGQVVSTKNRRKK